MTPKSGLSLDYRESMKTDIPIFTSYDEAFALQTGLSATCTPMLEQML